MFDPSGRGGAAEFTFPAAAAAAPLAAPAAAPIILARPAVFTVSGVTRPISNEIFAVPPGPNVAPGPRATMLGPRPPTPPCDIFSSECDRMDSTMLRNGAVAGMLNSAVTPEGVERTLVGPVLAVAPLLLLLFIDCHADCDVLVLLLPERVDPLRRLRM
uniref:Uncharacterized protein n=1 Tax=Cacopsylla melanoneura TaxID=428564 RepID=A0A8D9EPZ9_9HEMI